MKSKILKQKNRPIDEDSAEHQSDVETSVVTKQLLDPLDDESSSEDENPKKDQQLKLDNKAGSKVKAKSTDEAVPG